jgi:hypothetical protein
MTCLARTRRRTPESVGESRPLDGSGCYGLDLFGLAQGLHRSGSDAGDLSAVYRRGAAVKKSLPELETPGAEATLLKDELGVEKGMDMAERELKDARDTCSDLGIHMMRRSWY